MAKFITVRLGRDVANQFIRWNHRHALPVKFNLACIGAVQPMNIPDTIQLGDMYIRGRGKLVGVAILHRPVSRYLDDGVTAEISRLATDGTRNACSYLLGACARRAFKKMRKLRLITYTLATESGASLRGAGWTRQCYDRKATWITNPETGNRTWSFEDIPFPPRDWARNGREGGSLVTPAARWRWVKFSPDVFDRHIEDTDGFTPAVRLGFAAQQKGVGLNKNPFLSGALDHAGLWSDWREGWHHGYYGDLYGHDVYAS